MAVVFTDNFTAGADTAITLWPSSGDPDYAAARNGGGLTVNAANDHARITTESANDQWARLIDAAVPTGDQEITATVYVSGTAQAQGQIGVRWSGTTGDGYLLFRENSTTVSLYRIDAGIFTSPLVQITGTFTDNAEHTVRLRATGTNPVELDFTYAGVNGSYSDSDANRKTSGTPSIGVFNNGAGPGNAYVDNVSIDDTISGSIDQQAFRFGADDGSESAHTWLGDQNTNITQPLNTNTLIRFLLQATGAPGARNFKLQWRRSTEGADGWKDVT